MHSTLGATTDLLLSAPFTATARHCTSLAVLWQAMFDFAAAAAEEGGGAAAEQRLLQMLRATYRMLRPGGLLCIVSARGWPNTSPLIGADPASAAASGSGLPGVDACWWRWPEVARYLERNFVEAPDTYNGHESDTEPEDANESNQSANEQPDLSHLQTQGHQV